MRAVVLFGEMGSGKSFLGRTLARQTGLPYFEGDDFLPAELKAKVAKVNPLTVFEVNLFVTGHLIPGIIELARLHKNFVVSQALYRRDHREQIQTELNMLQIDVEYRWVRPRSFFSHISQLAKRSRGFKWIAVMLVSKLWFQKPDSNVPAIHNDFKTQPTIK
ncbi:MAG: hypothetical protein K8S54_08660 [Spirochaetia bacterium]|nr:hypothetical protein [Spirochaetia bacterium]